VNIKIFQAFGSCIEHLLQTTLEKRLTVMLDAYNADKKLFKVSIIFILPYN